MIMGVLYFGDRRFFSCCRLSPRRCRSCFRSKRRKWWLGLLLPAFCVLAGGVLEIGLNGLPAAGSRPLAALWLVPFDGGHPAAGLGILPGKVRRLRAVCVILAVGLRLLVLQRNDGGTVEYRALLYRAAFYHRILPEEQGQEIVAYDTHIEIAFFPFNWMNDTE